MRRLGLLLLLAACDEAGDPNRYATYTPGALDFGAVSAAGERTLHIAVESHGQVMKIESARIDNAKFRFSVAAKLVEGLGPGLTSTIAVRYRPCPDGWEGEQRRAGFDFSGCVGTRDSGLLNLTDDTPGRGALITLGGRSAPAPALELGCARRCGGPVEAGCDSIEVGVISSKGPACTIALELSNASPTALGITKLAAELSPTAHAAITGELARLETNARARFSLSLEARGIGAIDGALLIESDDPRARRIPIRGTARAPRVELAPATLRFTRSAPGMEQRARLAVRNTGDDTLAVSAVRLEDAGPFSLSAAAFELAPTEARDLEVSYAGSREAARARIVVSSDDPSAPEVAATIEVTLVPRLCATPLALSFPPATAQFQLENCGEGALAIERLRITGPLGVEPHPSIEDFSIDGCGRDCAPGIVLCKPTSDDCRATRTTLTVVYANVDGSRTDAAEIAIHSNGGELGVGLSGQSDR